LVSTMLTSDVLCRRGVAVGVGGDP
jgi:hypothetical protein